MAQKAYARHQHASIWYPASIPGNYPTGFSYDHRHPQDAVVGPGGKIEIHAPGLTPGQRVTVTIEPEQTEDRSGPHVMAIIKDLPGGRLFKTAEVVDDYIREEHDSWDR